MAACGASTSGRCDALRPAFKLVRCGRRVQWSARSAPVRAEAAADATSSGSGAAALQREQQLRRDPYKLAGHRLRTLLNGVGDGEVGHRSSQLVGMLGEPVSRPLLPLAPPPPPAASSPASLRLCPLLLSPPTTGGDDEQHA